MIIMKIIRFISIIVLTVGFFGQNALGSHVAENKFSLTLKNQSLTTVINNIEQKTGFTIIVDAEIANANISGIFDDVTVYEFFSRVFKEKNIVLLTDTEQNRITVSNMQSGKQLGSKQIANNEKLVEESNSILTSEADYIDKAKKNVTVLSQDEIKNLNIDRLTGKNWAEVEHQISSVEKKKSKKIQLSEADILTSESDYIAKAKLAVKNKSSKEIEETQIDSLTGRSWNEIELQM